jgi:hypothetical protein
MGLRNIIRYAGGRRFAADLRRKTKVCVICKNLFNPKSKERTCWHMTCKLAYRRWRDRLNMRKWRIAQRKLKKKALLQKNRIMSAKSIVKLIKS